MRDPNSFLPGPNRLGTPRASTNLVLRHPVAAPRSSDRQRETAQDYADQVGKAADRVLRMISPGTSIVLGSRTGAGGSSDSYAQIVKEYYSRNWDPRGVSRDDGTAVVTVVIGSDGRVVAARITKSSRDTALDETVQRALDRVRSIEPFENGAREKQRTFTINFNARTRNLGD